MKTNKVITYASLNSTSGSAQDPVRSELGLLYYVKDNGSLEYGTSGNGLKIVTGDTQNIETSLWTMQKQRIQLYSESGSFINQEEWQDYVINLVQTNTLYTDLNHQIISPLSLKEQEEFQSSGPFSTVAAIPNYNFYCKLYERDTLRSNTPENALPSLYGYDAFLNEESTELANNILAGGNLSKSDVDKLKDNGNLQEYFNAFSKVNVNASLAMQNLFFTSNGLESLKDSNSKKFVFPMYSEILLSPDNVVPFANILNDANLSSEFMTALYNVNQMNMSQEFVQNINFDGNATTSNVSTKIFDVTAWYTNFTKNGAQAPRNNISFVGASDEDTEMAQGELSSFDQQFAGLIFSGKLKSYVDARLRNFKNMADGVDATSETIAYKVAKYKSNNPSTPIQTLWFFNTGELELIEYIDTQVKYDNNYIYEVYAYTFVLGTEYIYKNLSVSADVADDCIQLVDVLGKKPVQQQIQYKVDHNPITRGTTLIPVTNNPLFIAEMDVITRPCMKVLETLLYSKQIKILDNPPPPPDLEMIPYIGVKDKIRIQFGAGMGEFKTEPIIIEPSDQALFDAYRSARDLSSDDLITFSADDYPVRYDIYRLTKKPQQYSDFSGALRASLQRTGEIMDTSEAFPIGAYNDSIAPNQKYYYTVRCVDVHNNISNPTAVHEIEMVEDGGAIYLVHNVIDLEITKPYTLSKPMKRFVYLVPNMAQSLIDEAASRFDEFSSAKDLRDRIVLGQAEDKIWDKKLKMRLTSKKTGRKIDVNLNFSFDHVRTKVENE